MARRTSRLKKIMKWCVVIVYCLGSYHYCPYYISPIELIGMLWNYANIACVGFIGWIGQIWLIEAIQASYLSSCFYNSIENILRYMDVFATFVLEKDSRHFYEFYGEEYIPQDEFLSKFGQNIDLLLKITWVLTYHFIKRYSRFVLWIG